MLGMFTALGMRDLNAMGAIRTLLAATINAAAVLTSSLRARFCGQSAW